MGLGDLCGSEGGLPATGSRDSLVGIASFGPAVSGALRLIFWA